MLGGRGRVRVVGGERNPDVRLDVSGQHRQHLASQLRGLDLHVLVQRRVALHLYDDRTAGNVLFVLPGGPVGLSMTITITAFERSPDGGKGLARDTRVR